MGGIRVANVKKTKVQIDMNGNEVKPFTKEVIQRAEPAYIPTPEQMAAVAEKPAEPNQNALGEMISKKVEEKIATAVANAIGKVDIEAIVAKALEQALK